jgi:hypothetical protein
VLEEMNLHQLHNLDDDTAWNMVLDLFRLWRPGYHDDLSTGMVAQKDEKPLRLASSAIAWLEIIGVSIYDYVGYRNGSVLFPIKIGRCRLKVI